MKRFRVDHFYLANDPDCGCITVEKRTDKTISVVNQYGARFRMKIRIDENGNEYAYDSAVPVKWRFAFGYEAINEG